tara:strand:+ start:464 stop:742 length:279 start_codon:yes stop_codon:yes gene_type:complete
MTLIAHGLVWSGKHKKMESPLIMSVQENAKKLNVSSSGPLVDTVEVPQGTSRISCDGGGALGHPVIWLTLIVQPSGGTLAVCPYCSRQFVGK